MTRTEGNVNQWVEIFANFRKGSVLTEIIKEEEPFIREPYWLSPLFEEDYRRYHTFEIEGISRGEQFPFEGDGPLWDGVCKDDISRKYLFMRVVDSPDALTGSAENLSQEEKAGMEQAYRMLNLDGDFESWYKEYYPVAKELTYAALLSDPMGKHLDRGYRCELIILNLINNYFGTKTTKEEWDAFYEEMILKMFGKRGIPYFVFTVDFEV